jgi:RNA polymerase sigma-70 factor (ECF subfamily)
VSAAAGVIDPDREALARVAAGDAEAFAGIVERHQERLVRLCERMLGDREAARDAVQEVFLKAYRKAGSYRPHGAVFTWLYRIAVNHCLNRLRRRKVVRFLRLERPGDDPDGPAFDPADPAPDPAAAAAARARWTAVSRAIARLPPGQRAVLVLARFEGFRYRRIAELLGITEGAVESRLFRAVRALAAAVEAAPAPARGAPPSQGAPPAQGAALARGAPPSQGAPPAQGAPAPRVSEREERS